MSTDTSPHIDGTEAVNILQQIPSPVMAVNKEMEIIYLNSAGQNLINTPLVELLGKPCYDVFRSEHCNTPNCKMRQVISGGQPSLQRNTITVGDTAIPIEYMAAPFKDNEGNIVGGVEFFQDISDRVEQERKIREQSRTIMEISTPAIKLWDRIIILPVVGVVDSLRAQQMMNTMLEKIMSTTAKVIILDIQGVAAVDTAVANHLIKIAKATKLMGCRCIISGISPAVAETLVELGIDLGDIATNSTLQDALADAFSIMDLEVCPRK